MITINPSSSVIIYVMTATNKRLLISESHGDSNWCTPCRGNPTNTSHASHTQSAYGLRPYISHVVHIYQPFVRRRQIWMDPIAPEKNGSRYNPQHTGWSIRGSVPSFSLEPTNETMGVSQAHVDDQLLGLPGPYRRYAIGTFNTCSRGPTHRSLTDIDGGYNLGGTGLPHTTHRPSQPIASTFR
jgi:hypothetical protein